MTATAANRQPKTGRRARAARSESAADSRQATARSEAGADNRQYALCIEDLSVAYGATRVLSDIHLRVPAGTLTAIVGPNGAGKSTLLRAILDIVPKISGQIIIFDEPYRLHRFMTAFVPQRNSIDWQYPVDVLDVVTMGLYRQIGWVRRITAAHRQRAMEALRQVDMVDHAHTHISELSGGQQQRIFIARALVQDAQLYFLDEPFAGVDAKTEAAIIALLKRLRDDGKTAVVVHHDLRTVRQYYDRVIMLNRTIIADGETERVFTADNLHRCYGGQIAIIDHHPPTPTAHQRRSPAPTAPRTGTP